MVDKASVKGLHGKLLSYKEEYRELKNNIKELEEEEKRLKEELERVRNHLEYYDSLISDMKKKMQGRTNLDFFDHL